MSAVPAQASPGLAARVWLWGPVVALMAAIFVLSAQPSLPTPPGSFGDKEAHALVYGLLGALWLRALAGGRWEGVTVTAACKAVLLTTAYGITDEIHQAFGPTRTPEVADVLADAFGAAVAVGLVLACGIILARRQARPAGASR